MEKLHTVLYIEHTDALIKIMVVQIGADNSIQIKNDVYNEICHTLRKYPYETGGIIGTDERGVITAFQFDNIQNMSLYEYCPNTEFLNKVINDRWDKKNIKFIGFVHSHLHNSECSPQDVEYARQILKANRQINSILLGIVSLESNSIKWVLIK